jgi:Delta3-Delta2-enoyl-CoA isomerase
MPYLDRDGEVFLLNLGDDENRFNPRWLDDIDRILDQVEAAPLPRALVTVAVGKFWSNGLDLAWMAGNADGIDGLLADVHALFARLLAFPAPTVAAIGGHAFAAGAMLALAHDFRVMRVDRGFFCLPEIDIQLPFTPGMAALIRARLSPATAHEAMTTGRRYGGSDALVAGIVDAVAPEDEVVASALTLAGSLAAKDGPTLATIKSRMYPDALAALTSAATNPATPYR